MIILYLTENFSHEYIYNKYYLNNLDYTINSIWGLGIGDWGLGPIPNPQSPIPKYLLNIYKSLIL